MFVGKTNLVAGSKKANGRPSHLPSPIMWGPFGGLPLLAPACHPSGGHSRGAGGGEAWGPAPGLPDLCLMLSLVCCVHVCWRSSGG